MALRDLEPERPSQGADSAPTAEGVDLSYGVVIELAAASRPPVLRGGPRDSIDLRWVARLPADTLRHLAAIADHYDRHEFRDPKLAAEELAEMLSRGQRPALGWYRRHVVPKEWPPTYKLREHSTSPGLGD